MDLPQDMILEICSHLGYFDLTNFINTSKIIRSRIQSLRLLEHSRKFDIQIIDNEPVILRIIINGAIYNFELSYYSADRFDWRYSHREVYHNLAEDFSDLLSGKKSYFLLQNDDDNCKILIGLDTDFYVRIIVTKCNYTGYSGYELTSRNAVSMDDVARKKIMDIIDRSNVLSSRATF